MLAEEWPLYYRDALEIGNRTASVGVCTLWTSRRRIAAALNRTLFAVAGNLYSRDGVNAILRNVLANPAIRYIILCGKSLNDSGQALAAFFKSGIDREYRIVGNGGAIDREIPLEAIQRVRDHVILIDLRGETSPDEVREIITSLKALPPFGAPEIFPLSQAQIDVYPSESNGFVVRGATVAETWAKLLFHVMTFGDVSSTDYGLQQKEILNVTTEVISESADKPFLPRWFPLSRREIQEYVEAFMSPARDTDVAYSYGHRLQSHWGTDQIRSMVADLKRFRLSRRAVASVWDPRYDPTSLDPPCIDLIQATVRRGLLNLTAYVRSHDVFRAWHLNAFALKGLQGRIVRELEDLGPGSLTVVSHSAHVYEDCWTQALHLLGTVMDDLILPTRFRADPRGSFVIRIEQDTIAVYHYSPGGDRLRCLEGKSAKELSTKLAPFIALTDHALYVGRELHRAEQALRHRIRYEQDAVT